jgi:site-specific DNA-cytosine methylase
MAAYYNEWDKNAAAWLRELIKMGLIACGEVDERSITEVAASDLRGFDQCHFFAGIGGWSLALRLAGVDDSYPVWTASLPCQPFSAAGKQLGKSDERHLLPHYLELVKQCRPSLQIGEQVEGAIRHGWLDDLQTTMEAEGYAVGHCVLGAHSVGSYHQRQRLYWVAHTPSERHTREHSLLQWMERGRDQEESLETSGSREIDFIFCRDNKYRPIKPSSIWMVNGISCRMVQCGDNGIAHIEILEKEMKNAEKTTTNTGEILPILQCENGEEKIPEYVRGYDRLYEAEVLQPRLHGESIRRDDENGNIKKQSPSIKEASQRMLSGVWKKTHTSCPSCGQESYEQRSIEFDDVVFKMPPTSTFSEFLGTDGSCYMQMLRKTGDEDRALLDSQYPAKEVWESLDDKEKDRVRIHFNNRAWVISDALKPLVDGIPRGMVRSGYTSQPINANETQEARVMRLKGYGNAIVPQVAAEFIGAFLHVTGETK